MEILVSTILDGFWSIEKKHAGTQQNTCRTWNFKMTIAEHWFTMSIHFLGLCKLCKLFQCSTSSWAFLCMFTICSIFGNYAVLDFTRQLVEIGADDEMVSSLVVFALQYVLVNHENWSYKFGYDRWKVTQKVHVFTFIIVIFFALNLTSVLLNLGWFKLSLSECSQIA